MSYDRSKKSGLKVGANETKGYPSLLACARAKVFRARKHTSQQSQLFRLAAATLWLPTRSLLRKFRARAHVHFPGPSSGRVARKVLDIPAMSQLILCRALKGLQLAERASLHLHYSM